MNAFDRVRKKYGHNICRRCINREYHVHLRHSDCQYGNPFPGLCSCCGQPNNLVTGLKATGRLKLLGK